MSQITLTPQQFADAANALFGSIVVRPIGAYPEDLDWAAHARSVAEDLNARAGRQLLALVVSAEPLTPAELSEWLASPGFVRGEYQTRAVFEAIRKRSPSHGEAIASGRVLASMATRCRREGPWNFYWLDRVSGASAD